MAKQTRRRGGRIAKAPTPAPQASDLIQRYEAAIRKRDRLKARAILEDIIRRDPNWAGAQIAYAKLLFDFYGEWERPRALLEPFVERSDRSEVLTTLAHIAAGLGEVEAAADYAQRAIARFPEIGDGYQILQRARPELGAQIAAQIHAVMARGGLTERSRRILHATLGRIHAAQAAPEQAFIEFGRANALRMGAYSPADVEHYLRATAEVYDAPTLERLRRLGVSDSRPVFIVGMPRSGSTLLERILAQHPKIETVGEREELVLLAEELRAQSGAPRVGESGAADYLTQIGKHDARALAARYSAMVRPALRNPEAARHLDKMPGNFMMIGLIKTIFPKARIIHARRNPADTALSCYMEAFEDGHLYTRRLDHLAHYIVQQRRLMAHWRELMGEELLEVRYEDVVADHEGEARRALRHLGLDWDAACLSPQESNRPVRTASVAQVRRPIYKDSVAKWRAYERELEPLFAAWRAMGDDVHRMMMDEIQAR